jgi:hypothetical protein
MRGETHGLDRTIAQLILMEADSMQAYRKIVILLIELRAVALVSPKLAYTHDHQRMDLNAWSQSLKQVRRFMLRRWRGRARRSQMGHGEKWLQGPSEKSDKAE